MFTSLLLTIAYADFSLGVATNKLEQKFGRCGASVNHFMTDWYPYEDYIWPYTARIALGKLSIAFDADANPDQTETFVSLCREFPVFDDMLLSGNGVDDGFIEAILPSRRLNYLLIEETSVSSDGINKIIQQNSTAFLSSKGNPQVSPSRLSYDRAKKLNILINVQ